MPSLRNIIIGFVLAILNRGRFPVGVTSSPALLMATTSPGPDVVARPQQGGERLTIEHIQAMPPRECIWHFRYDKKCFFGWI